MAKFKDEDEKIKAFKRLFTEHQDGIDVLEYLRDMYYDKLSYIQKDKEHTFFNEGRRDVVCKILRYVNTEIKN